MSRSWHRTSASCRYARRYYRRGTWPSFNIVRDGVDDPGPDQPKAGDRSAILGARYQTEHYYAAVTVSRFRQHETDDLGRYYDGYGVELYGDHDLTRRIRLRGNMSYLQPSSGHPGSFRVLTFSAGISYDLLESLRLFAIFRLDRSRNSDGSRPGDDTLALMAMYNF